MGYKNYGKGLFLPVRIHNGNVEIKFSSGTELYKTRLKVDTDWQVNEFYMLDTLFVIEHSDIRYVGRPDGTISGYNVKDGLLVLASGWDVPPKPRLRVIGAVHTLIACAAELDSVRNRVVYAPYANAEFVFDEPFKDGVFMPTSLADSMSNGGLQKLYITTDSGEEVDCSAKGQWIVQAPFTGVCDTNIF